MIYFDNGATTLIKPESVYRAQGWAARRCASVGRSGHKPAQLAGETVFKSRCAVAKLMNLNDPERVVFTYNATYALNMAIKGMCHRCRNAVISPFEHNSVVRPLSKLELEGVHVTVLGGGLWDDDALIESAEKAIKNGADLFVINHVSNVFGYILPIDRLDKLLSARGIPMILDASQSAGVWDIDTKKLQSLAAVCMPGHKSLYGPQGTGVLLVLNDSLNDTLLEGGTGSQSSDRQQPGFLPDRFESGTLNVPGIAGLGAGVDFVQNMGLGKIQNHETALVKQLAEGLSQIVNTKVFYCGDTGKQSGVLSFVNNKIGCEMIAERLAEKDICVRAGLHCAPLAHQAAGTYETGTVRASVGCFNTSLEVAEFLENYRLIADKFK